VRFMRMSDDGMIGDVIRLCLMILFSKVHTGLRIFVIIWLSVRFFVCSFLSL